MGVSVRAKELLYVEQSCENEDAEVVFLKCIELGGLTAGLTQDGNKCSPCELCGFNVF